MMNPRQAARFTVIVVLMVLSGLAAAAYVLLQERLPNPLVGSYTVRVDLTAADGVQPGLGQPVNVAGVKVGTITGATLDRAGNAVVTAQIDRSQLPALYANASAALDPITPLGDIELNLSPGSPPSPRLSGGATIGVGRTTSPVPLSDLLSTLDADTRDFVTSMLSALQEGTAGRGPDLRRALLALGPTAAQLHEITAAMARRRTALADLVHNLALVTHDASGDQQLAALVSAGNVTLRAVAGNETPLQNTIAELPPTLSAATATLSHAATFSTQLRPTLVALQPSINVLPRTLRDLGSLSATGVTTLRDQVRPLLRQALPLVQMLAPATQRLQQLAPYMTQSFQVLEYLTNEFAYNGGPSNPGFLFWLDWFGHNGDSFFSLADAHGPIGRVTFLTTCSQGLNLLGSGSVGTVLADALGIGNLCPSTS